MNRGSEGRLRVPGFSVQDFELRPRGTGVYATSRHGNLMLLDLKAEKKFRINNTTINASVDVFNLTNGNTVLARVTTQNAATANRVTEVTGPRVLRFGLTFSF